MKYLENVLKNFHKVMTYGKEIELPLLYHENSKLSKKKYFRSIEYESIIASTKGVNNLLKQLQLSKKQYDLSPKIFLEKKANNLLYKAKLVRTLQKRSSIRYFRREKIDFDIFSQILFYTAGIRAKNEEFCYYSYMYPSTGALSSTEVYLLILRVKNVPSGVYHYDSLKHALSFIREVPERDLEEKCVELFCMQHYFASASFFVIITSFLPKILFKYGTRGYRYSLLEAGHVIQNLYLAATACKLGACSIGGFFDDELSDFIGVDSVFEVPVYAAAVGSPSKSKLKV